MDLRTLTLLLTLCLGSSVGVLQVPLHRSAVPARTSEGSVLVYHTVDVTIGTPPQKFNLTLDLGDYYAYVFDKKYRQTDCKHPTGQRHLFDRYSSTTYQQKTADHYPFLLQSDQYFDYCIGSLRLIPSGVVGNDVLSLSGLSVQTNFAVIRQQVNASLQPFWPSDGALGMIRRDDDDMGMSPIVNLATAAGGPVVTLFTGSDTTARPGVLTLGGTDTLGRLSTSQPMTAILLAHTKTFVPAALFKQIASTIGAEYDFVSDEYVVACGSVKSLPDLVLTFDGAFEYRVPAAEYVKNLIPRKDKMCTLLIGGLPAGDPNFILGWQMLNPYCWRFNYGANELAVAKSKPF